MPKPRITMAPPEDPRFKETFFLVEASSFEKQSLWERWNDLLVWEDQNRGCIGQVGILDDRSVVISVFWANIEGKLVAFWEPTSQVVDYKMIEEWFAQNCVPPKVDRGTRNARCNAMNFHSCIHAIREANESQPSVAVS